MPRLAQRRAKRHKLSLGQGASELLAATVGADLTLMERALEKLVLAVPTGQVTEADVAAHVSDTHAEDAFAFVRAVAVGDRASASSAVAALQAARDEPIRLVGLLAWQLRLVLRARDILDQGGNPGQALNLFGDRAQPVIAAARAFSVAEHRTRLQRLTELDQALKSSRAPPWVTFGHTIDLLTEPRPQRR
jgi:DNA polymerase III subunit delta